MQKPLERGDIVQSKTGHDEGRIYVVVTSQIDGFITVSDGAYRPLTKLKTKRATHVRLLSRGDERGSGLKEKPTDTEIKRIIKLWRENAERR